MDLPADVATRVARGVAAYLRDTPANEVPARLRRFRGFTDRGLAPHKKALVDALDDDDLRAKVADWLKDPPSLAKEDLRLLTLAVERPDGWGDELRAKARPATPKGKPEVERLRDELEREKKKASAARDDLRTAKEEGRAAIKAEKQRAVELRKEIEELKRTLAEARRETESANKEVARVRKDADKQERSLRRDADRAAAERAKAAARMREVKKESAELHRRVAQLERALESERAKRKAKPPAKKEPSGPRKPLPFPKGRLADDPETLEEWLSTDGVLFLVDGYNAAKVEGGFGDADLVTQRRLLVEGLERLARKTGAKTSVVFDGAEVGPGVSRRSRGPVDVQYSKADEIADDHIVALLEKLPPTPVVVATNDKELQDRVGKLGATVATSTQLLSLLRRAR